MTKRRIRKAFNRGRRGKKLLKRETDPELAKALEESGVETVDDAQALQLQMVEAALRRGIELQLARMMDTTLRILRDEFAFDQEMLAQFAQEFRERMSGPETTTETE